MISRLQFSIDIKAEKSNIWKALWEDDSYRSWAGVFFEGSYAVAKDNWAEGSKVLFLGADKSGIYSIIETHIPNKIIKFKHIGKVLKGEEEPMDEETKEWSGATETYRVIEGGDHHTLTIEIDILDEHLDYMKSTFPKAMEKMKQLSEN